MSLKINKENKKPEKEIMRLNNLPPLLTLYEVADLFRIAPKTVKNLNLPYSRVGTRGDRRYASESVLKYLETRRYA